MLSAAALSVLERQAGGGEVEGGEVEVEKGVMPLVVAHCPYMVATTYYHYTTNLWILMLEFRMSFPLAPAATSVYNLLG